MTCSTSFHSLKESRKFYEEFLGLECVRHAKPAIAVRCGLKFHIIAVEVGDALHPVNLLNHWGVDVGSKEEVDAAYDNALKYQLDFAVGFVPWLDTPEIVSEPSAKVQFSWMASPARIGAGALLDRNAFEQHPVITMTKDSALTRAFEFWAAAQRLQIQRILACDSLLAITGLVVSGIGISFFPTQFMRPWVERGLLVDLRSDPPLPDLEYCFLARR